MKLTETIINGLFIIETPVFNDCRGCFSKYYSSQIFDSLGFDIDIKEIYFSVNRKNVIRGMHFQNPPHGHNKIVFVSSGEINDVVLDIRKNSDTYGAYFSIGLSSDNGIGLLIPEGMAHGFHALHDSTIVNYAQTSCYSKEFDSGIRFDSFGYDWVVDDPIISDRDSSFLPFGMFASEF